MNTKQEHLLRLLKEIDSFCKKHDITYYCAAGTVLGAIRHGGFIPWDDDIDILMTRSEFMRFAAALKAEGLSDRSLEYFEGNHEHHSTVARYVSKSSTMFCHYHITGYAPAGISVDVFVLDPVPDDHDALIDHITRFFAYSDLVAPTLSHSNRLPSKYASIAGEYLEAARHRGVYEVAEELAGSLFSLDESSCQNYMLRWGSQPFIYPKEYFGMPEVMSFEDMMIPVPVKWPQYLATHYGFGWTDIPPQGSRDQHNTVFDPDRDYTELYTIRDNMYEQLKLYTLHRGMQAARRKSDAYLHIHEDFAANLQISLCKREILRNFEEAGLPYEPVRVAEDLLSSKHYAMLTSLYEPYIRLQTSSAFMGSHGHGSYYHILFPIVVPIDPELLYLLLQAMLRSGKENYVLKISNIYHSAGLEVEGLSEIRNALDRICTVSGLYYSGEYEQALIRIHETDSYREIPPLINYEWLSLVHTKMKPSQEDNLRVLSEKADAPVELLKAYGDLLYNRGNITGAEDQYASLLKRTRNGMMLNDILSKGFSFHTEDLADPAEKNASAVSVRVDALAVELSELCQKHNIELIKRNDSNGEAEYFLAASSVSKFMTEIGSDLPSYRKMFSWGNGDAVKAFDILYADTASIDCDLRYDADPSCCYTAVRVHIIRQAESGKLLRIQEHAVKEMDRSPYSSGRRKSDSKSDFYSKMAGLPDRKKRNYRKKVFRALLKKESRIRGAASEKDFSRTLKNAYSHIKPTASIFVLQSTAASYDDLFNSCNKAQYKSMPWYEYGTAVNKTTAFGKDVENVWHQFQTKV